MLNLQPWNRPNLEFSLAYIAWSRRWHLVVFALLGAAAGAGFAYFNPKTYAASALVLVVPQKVPERYVNSAVSTDLQDRLASISQQILSNSRLQKIVDDFQLYRQERARLYPEEILSLMRKRIQIKLEKGWANDRPGAFHVNFEGTDPGIVAEVTNRLVSLFLEENLRERELSAEGTSDFLETQLQEARRKLEDLESKIADYKIHHAGVLPGQESLLTSAITRQQQELQHNHEAAARDALAKSAIETALQSAKNSAAIAAQLHAGSHQSGPANEPKPLLRSEAIAIELQRARLRFTTRHPTVIDLQQELDSALETEKAAPRAVAASASPVPADSLQYTQWRLQNKEREDALKSQLAMVDHDIAARASRHSEVAAKITRLEQQLAQLPVSELQMGAITRDYELSLSNYKSLLEKRQNAQMAAEMEHRQKGESFKVLDPARVPQKALGWSIQAVSAIAAVAGVLLGLVGFLLWGLRENKLLGEWELPEGIPLLVHIPAFDPALKETAKCPN